MMMTLWRYSVFSTIAATSAHLSSCARNECGAPVFSGSHVTGWPVLTMVRGKVVVEDGTLVGGKEHGTYLPRSKPPGAATIP